MANPGRPRQDGGGGSSDASPSELRGQPLPLLFPVEPVSQVGPDLRNPDPGQEEGPTGSDQSLDEPGALYPDSPRVRLMGVDPEDEENRGELWCLECVSLLCCPCLCEEEEGEEDSRDIWGLPS